MEEEFAVQAALKNLLKNKLVESAHDVSDGGLAVALAESSLASIQAGKPLGAKIQGKTNLRMDHFLFGEDQSRIVISALPGSGEQILGACRTNGVPVQMIGTVAGTTLEINGVVRVGVEEMARRFNESLEKRLL